MALLSNTIVSALKRDSIIPDVIPDSADFVPSVLFSIIYPGGKEAVLSTELTREETLGTRDYFDAYGG
ncbi:hypothetical protein D9757_014298 [Collybiopsis confluens]|uniref:Uncharacterized protein n=1 Tax=Collybiopsis confluens TaxID=2823264 RepID=A0A8H5FSI0_9AGAR|nr:hypothetical protein D9757_014298 [Collybiopsis confluens]